MGLEIDLVLVLQRCRTYGAGQKLKVQFSKIMKKDWLHNKPFNIY
jgi:hypothetical protein